MSKVTVLDASAIIAFLQGEPGAELVGQALHSQRCVVSAANQAEVIAKALDRDAKPEAITTILSDLAYHVVDIPVADGEQAGWIRGQTKRVGLSLGDRLCLALAQRMRARVLTADRAWLEVSKTIGVDVVCIRPASH
jgi:ribonuclease VapC